MNKTTIIKLVTVSMLFALGSHVVWASEDGKPANIGEHSSSRGLTSVSSPVMQTNPQSANLEAPRTERQVVTLPEIRRIEKFCPGHKKKSWMSGTWWCNPRECQSREILVPAQVIISERYASAELQNLK